MARQLSLLFLILLAAGSTFGQQDRWANPKGFFSNETVTETEITPGVRWISASGRRDGQPLRTQVISVDLTKSGLSLQALLGQRQVNAAAGQYVQRSTTSQLLEDNDALAAINVAFFDIGATQAFQGLVIRDGIVLREPEPARPTVIFHPDGRTAIAEFTWDAHVHVQGQRRPLQGINRPQLHRDEIVVYLQPWSRSPGNKAAFAEGQKVRELLVEKTGFEPAESASGRARLIGRILEVRDGLDPVEIGPDQFVVSAGQSASSSLRNAAKGGEVEVAWQLKGAPADFPWHEIREAVSAQPMMIRNGKKESGSGAFWDGRHPRSAIGISRDGRQILMVVVDGRSSKSAGISIPSLMDYMAHMGAHEAMNFDGGGSSSMTARVDGKTQLLNNPSDARERLVPTGLGVVLRADASVLSQPRTWTGINGRQMRGIFQRYDEATEQVTLVLDGRRFTFPISSLIEADQALIRQ